MTDPQVEARPGIPANDLNAVPLNRRSPMRFLPWIGLLIGIRLFMYWFDLADPTTGTAVALEYTISLTGLVLGLFPIVQLALQKLRINWQSPSVKNRLMVALLLTAAFASWYAILPQLEGRRLFRKVHDESAYSTQAQILAHGHLWMPAHPLGPVFESFYVLDSPVYMAMYFVGGSAMFVPGIWLGLPYYVTPIVLSGLVVGLTYLLLVEWIDGLLALIGAIMLGSSYRLQYASVQVYNYQPMLILALLMTILCIAWCQKPTAWRALALGAVSGWAAICRPIDLIVFSIPIGTAIAIAICKNSTRRRLLQVLVMMVAAAPFLAAQIAVNIRVTGSALRTPYQMTLDRQFPGLKFSWHRELPVNHLPPTLIPQQMRLYDILYRGMLMRNASASRFELLTDLRAPATISVCLPCLALMLLIPVGLFGLKGRYRWMAPVTIVVFFFVYTLYPPFLEIYGLVIAPMIILLVLTSIEVFQRYCSPRLGRIVTGMLMATMITSSLSAMYIFAGFTEINFRPSPTLTAANNAIAAKVRAPALVLFVDDPISDVHEEPMYNQDVPWPDLAPVIRAHDLGREWNRKIFEYYAKVSPQRQVWRFWRKNNHFDYLGTPAEALHDLDFPPATTRPDPAPPSGR